MTRGRLAVAATLVAALLAVPSFHASTAVEYRFSFPEPQHHWLQVEALFTDLPAAPLELRISRSSPGRYSLHDFAKNVYDVHAFGQDGAELAMTRPDADGWIVSNHAAAVLVKYKVFGNLIDGTYLAIDPTHAHINMPAVILWARGLDDRPVLVTVSDPPGSMWRIATQLHPVVDNARGSPGATEPRSFTAPNLQYLMDSPIEFGPFGVRQFAQAGRRFVLAVHHTGTDAELDAFAAAVQKVVSEEAAVYGEFPSFEPNATYTFICDYLPYASEDGMEHRNSTVITSRGSLRSNESSLLDTVAHEFFHSWNVERIRPRSLEPFDFDRANMSGELWLAEGFTQYYGLLTLGRAGLVDHAATLQNLGGLVTSVIHDQAYRLRSAVEMSEMAVFTDGARPLDRTNWSNTYTSYYEFGGALAFGLDLALRERTEGRATLDDYMRGMWRVHGKPGALREGYVDRPYTLTDAEARLAEVSGDAGFARDFFKRYVAGHEILDYQQLLAPAGLALRLQYPGRASLGGVQLNDQRGGVRLARIPPLGSPAYAAGLDVDDEIRQLDGSRISSVADVNNVLQRHHPGNRVVLVFNEPSGTSRTATIALVEDPRLEIVPIEASGGTLTPPQKAFRARWLGKQVS